MAKLNMNNLNNGTAKIVHENKRVSTKTHTDLCTSDPFHTLPAEFENGSKFLRLRSCVPIIPL